VKVVPATEAFRAEFASEAVHARERLGAKLMPQALIDRVLELLSDYRAEHRVH
jgi:hypothetical protein